MRSSVIPKLYKGNQIKEDEMNWTLRNAYKVAVGNLERKTSLKETLNTLFPCIISLLLSSHADKTLNREVH